MAKTWGRREVLRGVAATGFAAAAGCDVVGARGVEPEDVAPLPDEEFTAGDAEDLHRRTQADGLVELTRQGVYVVAWDPAAPGAEDAYGGVGVVLDETRGLLALSAACSHLGCRVPFCVATQQFECPCHGAKFNAWGEWLGGPAPGGLHILPSRLIDGKLVVDPRDRLSTQRDRTFGPARSDEGGCVDL